MKRTKKIRIAPEELHPYDRTPPGALRPKQVEYMTQLDLQRAKLEDLRAASARKFAEWDREYQRRRGIPLNQPPKSY